MSKIDPKLHNRLQALISSMGYEFVGYELQPQGGRLMFRLYIDKESQEGRKPGVNLDDCSLVSRQVSALLDVEDPIQAKYVLEVSSPGIDRPLFELAHYEKFAGSEVKLKLHSPIENRRQVKGLIARVEGDTIHLVLNDTSVELSIPFSNIDKGNLIGNIN